MGTAWSNFIEEGAKSKEKVYEMVKWQNEMMEVESAKLRDQYSTDNARIKHITQDIMGWNQVNFILWLIYYVIVLGIFYLFYQNENIELSSNQKKYIGAFLVLYPFLITSFELIIYNFIVFIASLIKSQPYPKQGAEQPTFSFLDGLPSVYY
jgi:hypothetical protein